MKLHLKKAALMASCLLISGGLMAQSADSLSTKNYVKPFSPASAYRTWSIGITGGSVSSYTLFHGKDDWNTTGVDLGYGAYVKDQLLHSFGLQANFFMGKLHGSNNTSATSPYTRFTTNINYAVDLSGVLTLANISWGNKQNGIQPYLTGGGGFAGYKPIAYTAAGAQLKFKNGNTVSEFYIPVGAGLKFNISNGVNIDLGYQVNFMNSDNIDANVVGGTFDKYSYGHLGLEFALGKSSKPQLATHNPVAAMRTEYTIKEIALQNQIDAERAKNDALRQGLAATNANLATTNANMAKFTVDSDGDGVPDFYDKCPNTPAGTKVDGAGCPLPVAKNIIITEEDKKVVKDAIKNLEFDLGKATIRPVSFPSLDRVAELLVNKNFSLKLAGHTDNTGSAELNMSLSKDRAESIKAYLVSKGANASRIEATGYGMTQPIASNKTAKGRQANRRVEFTLY